MRSVRRWIIARLPIITLILLPVLLLWRVVFLGETLLPADLLRDVFPWKQAAQDAVPWNALMFDGIAEFYPWRHFAAVAETNGFLPFWNPHEFCGTPFAANAQSAIFYPPNAIFAILPVVMAFGASTILHMAATGIFLYLYLRRSLALDRGPALIGAITWQLCTWQVSWLELPTFLCVSCWIPAALFFVEECLSRPTIRSAGCLGAILGMMILAGHLQIALYSFLLIGSYVVYRSPAGIRAYRTQLIPIAGTASLVAVLLGLAQLLPSIELSHVSHRAGAVATWAAYPGYISLAVPVFQLVTLLMPGFYGDPTHGTYQGYTNYAENACYIGAFALLLAVGGVVASWRHRSETRFFAVAAIVALMLATGTPLNTVLYFGIPGFAQSGSPGRILVLWSISGAILAAMGAEELLNRGRIDRIRPRLALLISAGVALLVVALSISNLAATLNQRHIPLPEFVDPILHRPSTWVTPIVVIVAGSVILFLFHRGKIGLRSASIGIAVVVAVDLLASGIGYNRTNSAADVYPATPAVQYLQAHARAERIMPVNLSSRYGDPSASPHVLLPPNAAMAFGLNETQGYDSLFPGQYMAFAHTADADSTSPAPAANGNMVFTHGFLSDAGRAMSARYLLSVDPIDAPGVDAVLTDGYVHLYENSNASPRFETPGDEGRVTATIDNPNRLSIVAPQSPGKPSTLVVHDQYFPGWHATVDGKPVPVTERPYIFRTIQWTPGQDAGATANIEMTYRPAVLYVGVFCLSLGWGFFAFAVIRRSGRFRN